MPAKKLIEVALPLEAINEASAREKSIRHGHPSTLHLWWARRPLAAARAVLFASLVDDPDDPQARPEFVEACRALPKPSNVPPHEEVSPRTRLLGFLEQLVKWEATSDERILSQARRLIRLACGGNPPPVLDPFAGGGSIPLEAQRLGLQAHASDLNPVAVTINKAQIEIPPRFADQPPVNPRDRATMFERGAADDGTGMTRHAPTPPTTLWRGANGLAADVRYYGEWMRQRAWERIGHLYPSYVRPDGTSETVIAWLWARSVRSPNPAINAHVPLVRSFILSKKKGRECWAKPIVEPLPPSDQPDAPTHRLRFEVVRGAPPKGQDGTVDRKGGRCIISEEPISFEYIRQEGKAGRMGAMLMAIVTEGSNGRSYYSPDDGHVHIASSAAHMDYWKPNGEMPLKHRNFQGPVYGLYTYGDLFTARQLVALTTFSDLVHEAREQAYRDALAAGLPADETPLREGGRGARAYAEAISVYLAFAVDRAVDKLSSIASWDVSRDNVRNTFARQAIPMVWDYAETNLFSNSTGNWSSYIDWICKVAESFPASVSGQAAQHDATAVSPGLVILSTDPPYYDNIGYADLSDFFYVWLRRALRPVYPDLFSTLLVPKDAELIASPYRHDGDKEAAKRHFEDGMLRAFHNLRRFAHPDYPMSVYYAFKQHDAEPLEAELDEEADGADEAEAEAQLSPLNGANRQAARASTGWETMLTSLIRAGFAIVGTWPMRTELRNRMVGMGTNALASSIVLVCRPRPDDAPIMRRRQFIEALRQELPLALHELQSATIAPVDLAQASIGPGMAIYSRCRQVLESDGRPLEVRTALALINQALDEYLRQQEGELDTETRFAAAWFEQYAFQEGEFGQADVLARAKNTSVESARLAGLVQAERGRVRLLHWKDYATDWQPAQDKRLTVWEATHQLIGHLHRVGETGAARLLLQLPPHLVDEARQLAYRLYNACERKGWADHARDYNALVLSWSAISEEAARLRRAAQEGQGTRQQSLFDEA